MKRLVTRLAVIALLASAMFVPAAERIVFSADPLLGLAWLISGAPSAAVSRAAGMAIVALAVIVSLFIRRFWCRWLCPFGLILDGCRYCSRRYCSRRYCSRRLAGPRAALLGTGGKVLGCTALALTVLGGVGLLWLDPAILFLALVHGGKGAAVAFVSALFILAVTVFFPAFWCAGLCPAGGLSEILYQLGTPIRRFLAYCRFRTHNGKLPVAGRSPDTDRSPRRSFLRVLAGRAIAFFFGAAILLRLGRMEKITAAQVRPPGAVPPDLFLARCARCGQCVRSCPKNVLRSSRGQRDVGTPAADFSLGYCDDQCGRCSEVCPTGALKPLRADQRAASPMSVIELRRDHCRLWHDKECHLCQIECPAGAIRFVWNQEEYLHLPEIDAARCSGCGRCVYYCPGYNGAKGLVAGAKGLVARLPQDASPSMTEKDG